MKKYNIICALIFTMCLTGCSKSRGNIEETKENHDDKFVKIEANDNNESSNTEIADINIISDYTPDEINNANVFEEPDIDLKDYYNEVDNETNTDDINTDTNTQITQSNNVNKAIDKLMTEGGYETVKLLDEWNDNAINAYTYRVVFDESKMYTIIEDSKGNVYESENDYQYYLDNL